jgi:PAS domain S-box-containing protein
VDNIEKNSVLVVDDERLNIEVLNKILSPEYTIHITKNGTSVFELACKHTPDLILLDIIMPDMNGFDVLAQLKSSEKTRNIPVIIITGLNSVEDEEKGLALDAADFIHKPFSTKVVQSRVRHQIQIVNQIRAIEKYAHNMHLTLTKMETIVNNYRGVIWSVDNNGVITSFNGRYLNVIGVKPEFLIGKNISAARVRNKHTDLIDNLEKTFREGPQDWSTEIDGKMFRSHTMPMYDADGKMIGIVGSSDDVTELVELHTAIAATEEKSKFFAKMSHEMRTPLNAVIGLSELTLEEGGLGDEARENVEKIASAGASLLGLVNDVLDISKIEAGKFEFVPVEYDTPSIINDTVTQSIVRKGEKPIDFVLNIDENIPTRLYGDDLRIKQILNNLLSNAFKYTREGTVEFTIKSELQGEVVVVVVSVRDTGVGIPAGNIDNLFFDYARMDLKTNRKIEGTGLGLSITKMMVDMMGGSISVESEYGKGSIFTVRFPQGFVTADTIGPEVVSSLKNFHYHIRKRKARLSRISLPYAHVLVVDDVATNLDVARGMMKPYKMQVDCLTSGQAAVDAVREEKVKYNAIFMDHMMPEMDGVEAVRIIREEIGTEYAKTVPIIAFTANAITGNEEMFLSKGFQAFISKPIDISRLDAVIKQWIRNEELEKSYEAKQVTVDGHTFVDLRTGKDRRSGKDRRKGVDGHSFEKSIEGIDIAKGLERFGGDRETFLQVLKSFASNTKPLLETIKKPDESKLRDYAITVHGLKSSCRGICAEAAGNQAETLEKAAKTGDLNFVIANNPVLIEDVTKLITAIEERFSREETKKIKLKKDKPYKEALQRLKTACENYQIEEIDAAINEIEVFDYEADDGLVLWLRENVDQMNYMEIVERLSGLD